MDVMELRRRLMYYMPNGIQPITGTVIAPSTNANMVISFGKTIPKYMYLIEATDASKATIISSGVSEEKAYLWFGVYPLEGINGVTPVIYTTCVRYKPSANTISTSNTTVPTTSDTQIYIPTRVITSANANHAYFGLSYNYTILPLN